jgi:hypothetical protein
VMKHTAIIVPCHGTGDAANKEDVNRPHLFHILRVEINFPIYFTR